MVKTLLFLFLWSSQVTAQVLARVGATEINLKDFEEKYALLKTQALEVPDKKKFLDDLIRFEIGVQEAQKRGLENDVVIKERMRQELFKGFVEKELSTKMMKLNATDAEMRSYYTKNPEVRLQQILIEVRPDATAEQKKEARKRAQDIFENVRKSQRKFEELAKIYSDDTFSNKAGGDIGWQNRMTLYPSLYNQALKMSVGEISPLMETPYGFFMIKLAEKKSYSDADRSMLRLAVQEEKKKRLYDQLLNNLRAKYKIQVNKNLLN